MIRCGSTLVPSQLWVHIVEQNRFHGSDTSVGLPAEMADSGEVLQYWSFLDAPRTRWCPTVGPGVEYEPVNYRC